MDKCVYHSRDLDGLTSAAIISIYTDEQENHCQFHPLDYGEKLDIRTFKGKTACMIDVSMPMDRMEALGKICNDFTWIDHHKSAYDELMRYCETMGYSISERGVNSFIKCISVKEMNMNYFYSQSLSGCEITNRFYGYSLKKVAQNIINTLGQYDTWRDSDSKKLFFDSDWDYVLKIQYGMRNRFSVEKIKNILLTADAIIEESLLSEGSLILNYIKDNNLNYAMKNFFEVEAFGLKFIALNKEFPTGSMAFDGLYYPEIHDAMMAFCYDGKNNRMNVSMYTTKEDVDILNVAIENGGGGHKQACGFSVGVEEFFSRILNNKKQ